MMTTVVCWDFMKGQAIKECSELPEADEIV